MLSKRVRSGRRRGAVGSKPTKVTKVVRELSDDMSREYHCNPVILDFGAGKYAQQTYRLREQGYRVDPYDLEENSADYHQPDRGNKYDIVMASNVLNVQETLIDLLKTILEIKSWVKDSDTSLIVVNYPESPRYLPLSMADMRWLLESHFDIVDYTDEIFEMRLI